MRKKLITMVTALALAVTALAPTAAVKADGVADDIFNTPSLEIFCASGDPYYVSGEVEDYVDGEPYKYGLTIWSGGHVGEITRSTKFFGPTDESISSFLWYNGTEWVDASEFSKTYTLDGNEMNHPFEVTFGEDGLYVWSALILAPDGSEYRRSTRFFILEDGVLTVQPRAPHPTGLVAEGKVDGKHKITWDRMGDNTQIFYKIYINDEAITDAEGNAIKITGTNEYYIDDSVFPESGDYTIEVTATGYNNNRETALNEDYEIKYSVEKKNEYTVTVDGAEYATVEEGDTVTLPTTANIGYYVDGKLYKAGSTYTVTESVDVSSVSIAMANGAGIRFATPTGIRFQTSITSKDSTVFDSAVKSSGMLIIPQDVYIENEGVLDVTTTNALNIANSGWYGNTGTYCASIVNLAENNYTRNFVAKAYTTVEYVDGTTATVYSNVSSARSIQGVAAAIMLADEYNTLTAAQQALIKTFAAAE